MKALKLTSLQQLTFTYSGLVMTTIGNGPAQRRKRSLCLSPNRIHASSRPTENYMVR